MYFEPEFSWHQQEKEEEEEEEDREANKVICRFAGIFDCCCAVAVVPWRLKKLGMPVLPSFGEV